MKVRGILVLCLLALICIPALAQDKKPEGAMGGPEHEAMVKAMSPGAEHKQLAKRAGDWTFTSKMWMAPEAPPMESSGTVHGEMMLGGRYLHSVWKGNMMGTDFEGHGTDAYDNMSKQYVSTWVDNMATGIMYMTGSCSGKVCTSTGDVLDPMKGGQKTTMKGVTTWIDDSSYKFEMYSKDASGNETKMMEFLVKKK
jgi:hypothetical protein